MMFERFTADARTAVVQAQEHARRLGHRYIGCEHLLLAAAATEEPASAALRDHGVTPGRVESQIVRLTGLGHAVSLFSATDREALASLGIDLDAVRERIEAAFGPDAFTRAGPHACRTGRSRWQKRRAAQRHRGTAGLDAGPGAVTRGHIPFTPRAKKCIEHSLREARVRHDNHIGVEHLTLALLGMTDGAVPPILAALGTSPHSVRAAILDRYRRAS
jgi:ATP-dependent Clp protease ATP-binding subunit ClpA